MYQIKQKHTKHTTIYTMIQKQNQNNMKNCDKNSPISRKLHMIYISSNNDRHPVTKIFFQLHYSSRHFTPSHLKFHPNSLHLHPTRLHLHTTTLHLHPTTLHLHPTTLHLHPTTLNLHPTTLHLHPTTLH
jgi:hypothetical protein